MKRKTIILAILCCLLWGSAFPTVKTMYTIMAIGSDVGVKILLAGIRFTLAGLMILGFYTIRYGKSPILTNRVSWRQAATLGLTQTALMYGFYYIGIYNTSGVKSSIMSQVSIFLIVILAHFVYHDDRMHSGKIIGLLMGLFGIVLINFNALNATEGLFNFKATGEGMLLISGFFSTFTTFLVKRFGKTISPILLNGWQMVMGGSVLIFLGSLTATEPLSFSTPTAIGLLIYSSALSAGAFTLWYILLQTNKASELAMMRFTIPVFGAILSALLLPGESLTIYAVISLAMVALGIWMCNRPRKVV